MQMNGSSVKENIWDVSFNIPADLLSACEFSPESCFQGFNSKSDGETAAAVEHSTAERSSLLNPWRVTLSQRNSYYNNSFSELTASLHFHL